MFNKESEPTMCNRKYQTMTDRLMANSYADPERTFNGSSCWTWVGRKVLGRGGYYGRIGVRCGKPHSSTLLVHRLAYEVLVGPFKSELTIDHLCNNTLCINPNHLEPVTNAVNIQRRDMRNSARGV